MIAGGNHSFHMIRNSRECVINLPTTALTDHVVGIGNTSGRQIDKFAAFGLTAAEAHQVGAPLIRECHASFECRVYDDVLVDKYNFFIFEVLRRMSRPCRSTLRRCTIRARACSWCQARSSAGVHSSARRSCETHRTALVGHAGVVWTDDLARPMTH